MKKIADEWAAFRELVIPAAAGERQVEEMQRAFYAGGLAVFSIVFEMGSGDGDPTPEEVATFKAIHAELLGHGRRRIERDKART